MNNAENKKFEFVRIRVVRGTCYGSPALEIELNFQADGKVSASFSEYPKKKNILIESAEAEKIWSKIRAIIEKPEVLSDLRTVNYYRVEMEWENLSFIEDEKSGKFSVISNEWFTESIEDFMRHEAETTEIAERFQKILNKNPHRHALEIYRAVKDFSRKYLM